LYCRKAHGLEDIIEIGNALRGDKEALPHGLFLPW
jgi:hypothetical protein